MKSEKTTGTDDIESELEKATRMEDEYGKRKRVQQNVEVTVRFLKALLTTVFATSNKY